METNKKRLTKTKGSLVITRLPGRSVQIGDDITITVLDTNKQTGARLRITAPRNIDIKRFFESGLDRPG